MMVARKEEEPGMNKDEDYICFYRDAVIAGHDAPAAETMRRFNLARDYTVRLLNEAIARCTGDTGPHSVDRSSPFAGSENAPVVLVSDFVHV